MAIDDRPEQMSSPINNPTLFVDKQFIIFASCFQRLAVDTYLSCVRYKQALMVEKAATLIATSAVALLPPLFCILQNSGKVYLGLWGPCQPWWPYKLGLAIREDEK